MQNSNDNGGGKPKLKAPPPVLIGGVTSRPKTYKQMRYRVVTNAGRLGHSHFRALYDYTVTGTPWGPKQGKVRKNWRD